MGKEVCGDEGGVGRGKEVCREEGGVGSGEGGVRGGRRCGKWGRRCAGRKEGIIGQRLWIARGSG